MKWEQRSADGVARCSHTGRTIEISTVIDSRDSSRSVPYSPFPIKDCAHTHSGIHSHDLSKLKLRNSQREVVNRSKSLLALCQATATTITITIS